MPILRLCFDALMKMRWQDQKPSFSGCMGFWVKRLKLKIHVIFRLSWMCFIEHETFRYFLFVLLLLFGIICFFWFFDIKCCAVNCLVYYSSYIPNHFSSCLQLFRILVSQRHFFSWMNYRVSTNLPSTIFLYHALTQSNFHLK